MDPRKRSNPFFVVALICLALAGCGGDDEEQAKTTPTTTSDTTQTSNTPGPDERTDTDAHKKKDKQRTDKTRTETVPVPTTGNTPNPPIPTEKLPVPKRVQKQGDEVPAQSLALFMANGGRITPRVVRVPPFISVRVVLLATDGRAYAIDFGKQRVTTSPTVSSVAKRFPGLRPGKVLVGRVIGGRGSVRIEANAEPGP